MDSDSLGRVLRVSPHRENRRLPVVTFHMPMCGTTRIQSKQFEPANSIV